MIFQSNANRAREGFQVNKFSDLLARLSENTITGLTDQDLMFGLRWLGKRWNEFYGENSSLLAENGGPFNPEELIISPHGKIFLKFYLRARKNCFWGLVVKIFNFTG